MKDLTKRRLYTAAILAIFPVAFPIGLLVIGWREVGRDTITSIPDAFRFVLKGVEP